MSEIMTTLSSPSEGLRDRLSLTAAKARAEADTYLYPKGNPRVKFLTAVADDLEAAVAALSQAEAERDRHFQKAQREESLRITAEADLKEAREWIDEATKTITGLTVSGSEFFVRRGDTYRADLKACAEHIRGRYQRNHKLTCNAIRDCRAAEARAAKAEEALEPFAKLADATDHLEWMKDHCQISWYVQGYDPYALFTAGDFRRARAILASLRSDTQSETTDTKDGRVSGSREPSASIQQEWDDYVEVSKPLICGCIPDRPLTSPRDCYRGLGTDDCQLEHELGAQKETSHD